VNVLFIGAHTDDIEHGAGATMLALSSRTDVKIFYLTLSLCKDIERNKLIGQDQERARNKLNELNIDVSMLDFPNRRLNEHSFEIRLAFEHIRDTFLPDVIYTHWTEDIHQDHKAVAEESLRVFRNQTVYAYECIRSCPRFFANHFFPISEDELLKKIELVQMYETQANLRYNLPQVTRALAITRGAEIGRDFAEGFLVVRSIGR
jgi:LmbE family N-acetylglucosaminyl deacetylase